MSGHTSGTVSLETEFFSRLFLCFFASDWRGTAVIFARFYTAPNAKRPKRGNFRVFLPKLPKIRAVPVCPAGFVNH
jgi:hypothetical protein